MCKIRLKAMVTTEAAVIVSIYIITLSALMAYSFTGHNDIVSTASLELKKPWYTVYQILSLKHIGGEIYEEFTGGNYKEAKHVGQLQGDNARYRDR